MSGHDYDCEAGLRGECAAARGDLERLAGICERWAALERERAEIAARLRVRLERAGAGELDPEDRLRRDMLRGAEGRRHRAELERDYWQRLARWEA